MLVDCDVFNGSRIAPGHVIIVVLLQQCLTPPGVMMANVDLSVFEDPYERLGAALVMNAARDLQSSDSERRAAARVWLREDCAAPLTFGDVCRLLDADREYIRGAIEARAGGGDG